MIIMQARHAEIYGAKGILMYTDPRDSAMDGVDSVYPESWWMPPTGVQRGSVLLFEGDPLTPFYPSISKYIFRKLVIRFSSSSSKLYTKITFSYLLLTIHQKVSYSIHLSFISHHHIMMNVIICTLE